MNTKHTHIATEADRAKDPYLSADSIVYENEQTAKWRINRALSRDGSALWANIYDEGTHEIVCHLDGDNKMDKAHRIVTACNAHDELVGALQALIDCPDYKGIKTHEMRIAEQLLVSLKRE